MENDDTLERLLKIEKEAASLVNEAQAEADRRIAESEKQNRAACEKKYRVHEQALEEELKKKTDELKTEFKKQIETYLDELSLLKADTKKFSSLLDSLIFGEGQ
jgi:F0F1-type ATP synthase membrane subunit b/b'